MKRVSMRLLCAVLAVCMMLSMLPSATAASSNGEKIVYGYSGEGRELVAYRFGDGPNVMVLGFAIHGWEDNWSQDGKALVYTAEELMDSLKKSGLPAKRGWSVYVLPCMNPDGVYSGYSHDGPGRLTTRRYDSRGNLVVGGIDMNRCFPTNFVAMYNDRNYTGATPMGCPEAKALDQFIQKVKGSQTNILVDTHGWYQQTIVNTGRDGMIYKAFNKNFPQNTYTLNGKGQGYLITYAHSLGYDTCLFEFPRGLYSMNAYKNSGYCAKYIDSIETMLKSKPEICPKGHTWSITRTEPTCTTAGQDVRVCTVCGTKETISIAALGHYYSNGKVEIQAQTATSDGYDLSVCSRCGYEKLELTKPRVFRDTVDTAYYSEAVDYAYANGLVNGMTANTFGPNMNLTRGMLVTILHRFEGTPIAAEPAPFADVKASAYYADAVAWAYENGIVNGVTETAFAPNDLVTRQQTAAILFRYVSWRRQDNSVRAELTGFQDAGKVDHYAEEAMSWCVGNGIVNGTSPTMLSPRSNATRAQSLVMLYRVIQYLDQAPVQPEPEPEPEPDPMEPPVEELPEEPVPDLEEGIEELNVAA